MVPSVDKLSRLLRKPSPALLQEKSLILGKFRIDDLSEQLDPTVRGHGYKGSLQEQHQGRYPRSNRMESLTDPIKMLIWHTIYWIHFKTYSKKQRKEARQDMVQVSGPLYRILDYTPFTCPVSLGWISLPCWWCGYRVEIEQRDPTGGRCLEATHTCSIGESRGMSAHSHL